MVENVTDMSDEARARQTDALMKDWLEDQILQSGRTD